ncbi:uncharacterized protein LOC129943409 isoform X1 [Eupeodes corollae]|uniref:uncharacterized protein LOC129943409 isoform X1 n=1 Tax=Eupeodes corollae TaxID=290404 RepID=UPI0024918859|nr:uncharacterized protein LOC129943409 isoform X1 [Eupeodes corollae]
MSSWAERVHRRAADLGSVVTSCGHPGSGGTPSYPSYRLEKVKFGVPLEEVCKNDNIPGPLLVLILKLNKESPNRRDVFRAPGHQGAMKKLIHFLQAGRLVNVDNYSVYTIASVLKKFLRKIPNGVFGRLGENELFACIELDNEMEQQERIHRLITSLPKYAQHLLVLLFGTFRVIATNAAHAGTGMTSEALGVSVAPSFFQSCVSDGKTARMEDVLKFKVATKIMKHIIDKFAIHDLFGRANYEYYARVTGRILKVQDEWICSFQYPPPPRGKLAQQKYALQHSLEAEKTWLQCQCERWGLIAQEESRSTPALLTSSSSALDNSVLSLGVTPDHSFIESCARLSVSLEGPGLFAMATTSSPIPSPSKCDEDALDEGAYEDIEDENNPSNQMVEQQQTKQQQQQQLPQRRRMIITSGTASVTDECRKPMVAATCSRCNRGLKHSSSCSSTRSSKSTGSGSQQAQHHMTMDELRAVNRYAESTKSLSYLPQVHERQTARMRTRSEWFLGASGLTTTCSSCLAAQRAEEFMGGSHNDIPHEPSNEMYMIFKRRVAANATNNPMETDDVEDYCTGGQYLSPHGYRTDGNSSSTSGGRMFLETNFTTHSGSYNDDTTNNNYNHEASSHIVVHCSSTSPQTQHCHHNNHSRHHQQSYSHYYSSTSIASCGEDFEFHHHRQPSTSTSIYQSPKKTLSRSAHNLTLLLGDDSVESSIAHETVIAASGAASDREEVDFILTSRFRHSTPVTERRRNRRLRRQSSSSRRRQQMSQDSHNDSRNRNSSVNFVSVLFNVLDFLF